MRDAGTAARSVCSGPIAGRATGAVVPGLLGVNTRIIGASAPASCPGSSAAPTELAAQPVNVELRQNRKFHEPESRIVDRSH
jgi:hypothetical protein